MKGIEETDPETKRLLVMLAKGERSNSAVSLEYDRCLIYFISKGVLKFRQVIFSI